MRFKVFNPEVLFADESIVQVCAHDLNLLKTRASKNKRRRIRLCAHSKIEDRMHEMLIVHMRDAYVRPHKHLNKSESVHVIEGLVDVVIFDDDGKIANVIPMGELSTGRQFYYRLSGAHYHTLLIRSGFLVFHETTNGPFIREETVFPAWAPTEDDISAQKEFMSQIGRDIEAFVAG